ncbi:hypothetical protein GGI25_003237 [Coemansia spiralis]|uniref:Glycosyl transferase family 25 domain-containing protein n=2 Tax=Coemansia TaxID=4863 RepID=A0A9W8G8G6_9FUNG|nr:hypothetical protein BX070DRAFT_237979 [Coemansia spiralis]KAJ1987599.1 hypothetical protein EDC05_005741 [Coemansia umbellata]KAJ2619403.1 hypothetical protein GGI26_005864 [Coemansia sp. RSA 1358]KAJ2677142.1 hypothetical protein GGI25_003237 [Coemansia spiralis]
MVSIPGPGSAWWYGRAIRLYFLFSLTISALWIAKLLYINPPAIIVQGIKPIRSPNEFASPQLDNSINQHRNALVDESSINLAGPSPEYALAFTDHIYCVNEVNKIGRKSRMSELFRYMHLQVEMFSKKKVRHLDIWRDMINNGYERALIIEDDIDFEINAVSVIGKAIKSLNSTSTNWDILYVGHCSMEEGGTKSPKLGFSRLHKSVHPFCTSGYVLNLNGAKKLYAYFVKNSLQTHALDVQLVALIKRNLLKSFSVHPPVVYQRRDLYPSDDGFELKVVQLFKNSAWDEAVAFVPELTNWLDPLDSEYLDPAFKHIPSWMENTNRVN